MALSSIFSPVQLLLPSETCTFLIPRYTSHSVTATASASGVPIIPRYSCKPINVFFEDPAEGIICYKDDNEHIICKGYNDEALRFHQQRQQNLTTTYHPGDGEIMKQLLHQQQWLQNNIINNAEEETVAALQDHLNSKWL